MSTKEEFTQVLREWSEVFMHHSFRDFKRFMDESGLSVSQINTLMRLYHHGTCEVSDISDQLGITNAASSQLVERLVQQGLLNRTEDPRDRRVRQLEITPQGRVLIEQGIAARQRWMEELTHELSPEEQEEIANALILLSQAARRLDIND